MIITNHAYKRIKERIGLKKGAAKKLIDNSNGHRLYRKMCDGRLRKYLDRMWHNDFEKCNLFVFKNYLFVCDKGVLITVLHLPNNLRKIAQYQQEKLND